MEQSNPQKSNGQKVTEVVGGIRLVTQDYVVKVPVFEEEVVKQPIFVAEEIKVPTGWDRVTNAIALELSEKITAKVLELVDAKLAIAIKDRIDTIKVPKIIEEVKIVYKDVPVERAVITDVPVERAVFKDKIIINPVTKDVEIINALIIDKPVVNAIIEDVHVKNAVIKDIEVERAIIRDRVN